MERKQRSGVLEKSFVATTRAQFGNGKAARPVVSVHDVRRAVEILEQRKRSTRKEGETRVVVTVTVNGGTGEELRRREQVGWGSGRVAIQKTDVVNLAAPLNADVLDSTSVQ